MRSIECLIFAFNFNAVLFLFIKNKIKIAIKNNKSNMSEDCNTLNCLITINMMNAIEKFTPPIKKEALRCDKPKSTII
jgi:hypothetical protein